MNILKKRIFLILTIGLGGLVLILGAVSVTPGHSSEPSTLLQPEISWTYLDQYRLTLELRVTGVEDSYLYTVQCPVEKLALLGADGAVIAEEKNLLNCWPHENGGYYISQTFYHQLDVQPGVAHKLVLAVKFYQGEQTDVPLEILPSSGLTMFPNQVIERNGVSAELASLEVNKTSIAATICFNFPDTSDWWAYPHIEGQFITASRGTLLNHADETMQNTHRCYLYNLYSAQGFNLAGGKQLVIVIDDLQTSLPETITSAMVESANQRLASQGVQFTTHAQDRSWGIEIVAKPGNMSDEKAYELISDALPERVPGPWRFSVPLP